MTAAGRERDLTNALAEIAVCEVSFQALLRDRHLLDHLDIDRIKLAMRALEEARGRLEVCRGANKLLPDGADG